MSASELKASTNSKHVIAPKPGVMDVVPYVGGEARIEGVDRLVRLASNENPLGTSDAAKAAYQSLSSELHRYPDGGAAALRAAIAEYHGLPADQIVCGGGSEELISLLMHGYVGPGDEIVHSAHGFLMYKVYAQTVGATPVSAPERDLQVDVDAMIAAVTPKTKIVFVANPNNPTGSCLPATALKRLHAALPENVLLVIDSAYAEYLDDPTYTAGEDMVAANENVVMLRTFSKIHGLAGLRLGWGYFPSHVVDVLNRVRRTFNVDAAAQAAGIAALSDHDFIARSVAHNKKWLPKLDQALQDLGLKTYPSVCNFILAEFGDNAEEIRLKLRAQGVFIRQMGAYGLPRCLRISIGTDEENEILLQKLAEIL